MGDSKAAPITKKPTPEWVIIHKVCIHELPDKHAGGSTQESPLSRIMYTFQNYVYCLCNVGEQALRLSCNFHDWPFLTDSESDQKNKNSVHFTVSVKVLTSLP